VKELAKGLARLVALVLVLPAVAVYRLSALALDADRAFHGASQGMSLLPGALGDYLRREFYRLTLDACSDDCCISFGTIFSKRGARVGRHVYIGTHCNLGLVTLGDDVLLASNVDVLSGGGQHRFEDPNKPVREQGGTFERVTVGADTWIGNRSVVMADVGERCVVGAGSVVTKPLDAHSIAVGSPARVVGSRVRRPESDAGDARETAETLETSEAPTEEMP
jgi:acetyltransferase-like isoleucine patch superfamily enzyme